MESFENKIVVGNITMKIGDKVVRGPDWSWGYRDCYYGKNLIKSKGIIVDIRGHWVSVEWLNPEGKKFNKNSYIMSDDKQDLKLFCDIVQEEMEL